MIPFCFERLLGEKAAGYILSIGTAFEDTTCHTYIFFKG